jgi:alkaline phosphatase
MNKWFACVLLLTFSHLPSYAQTLGSPNVHSHNDYVREHPFWEAYEAGCGSIEVDVFLRNDTLFVAHEVAEINSNRTLKALYLEPIFETFKNTQAKPFQLLIDVKTAAEPTLQRVIAELQQFPDLLTQNKVKFVISGSRPAPRLYKNYPAYIFFDHQSIEDLGEIDLKKVALISLPFYKTAFWAGKEELPAMAEQKIKSIVGVVHAKELPFRFWATPDTELSWKIMSELGVDFINTDNPKACNTYLKNVN